MTNVRDTSQPMKTTRPRPSGAAVAERITAIFQIDGHGFDVVLTADCLSWTPLSGERKGRSECDWPEFQAETPTLLPIARA